MDTFGYIDPGHRLKGKQNVITCDQDLVEIYTVYKNKRDILLWCYVECEDVSKQRKRSATAKQSKQTPALKRMCESTIVAIQEVLEELKKRHGSKYTSERLNAWAHMINIGKHSSLDDPPNLPYFGKKKTNAGETSSQASTSVPTSSNSPSKRVSMRTQCIEQWHELLIKGAISESQYEELKRTIVKDMAVD